MTNNKILRATHDGNLNIGGAKISCAVLENGERILIERSVALAIGRKGGGDYWKKKKEAKNESAPILPEYVSAKYLEPYISSDLKEKLLAPISYINKSGEEAIGLPASTLPEICDVWLKARDYAKLTKSQMETARKADILMRGLASVGIAALIDEATGYQDIRKKDALQKILDAFISKELAAWVKRFPDEYYDEMFRLKGWNWNTLKRPSVVGKYTNDIVYERLAPNLVDELKKKTPRNESGNRNNKFHQWLTTDVGHPALSQHLYAVIGLMRTCQTWEQFKRLINRAFPKKGDQIEMFDN